MLFQICLDALAVQVFTQLRPEHVKYPTALWIGAVIKLLHRVFVCVVDNRFFVIPLSENAAGRITIQTIEHCITPELISFVEVGVVRCKTFVQPEVTPVFAGDVVSKPLVSQFVSVETARCPDVFVAVAKMVPSVMWSALRFPFHRQ